VKPDVDGYTKSRNHQNIAYSEKRIKTTNCWKQKEW